MVSEHSLAERQICYFGVWHRVATPSQISRDVPDLPRAVVLSPILARPAPGY